jgi:ubiquinone biosynthesis protein COQ4
MEEGADMKLWNRINLLRIFFQLVKNPNRTDLIFKAVDVLSHEPNNPVVLELERKMMENDKLRAMYETNYRPEVPAMETLARLPENSFGKRLHAHLMENDLDLNLFPRFVCRRPVEYMSFRIYQDHDLWHVLLGLGVSVEDEIALQAFGVAQYNSPIGAMLVAGGLLHLLIRDPMRAVKALGQVAEGYNLGKRAPFLLGLRLHEMFGRPIQEVRQICGVA